MTAITCVETGIVYRNPKPYLRSVQAYHPSLVVFDDGEMLVGLDLGAASESLDYRTYLSRSHDGGKNWDLMGRLFPDPPEQPSTHSVRLSRTSDGIVGFGYLAYREDPNEGLLNRQTLGFVPMDLILVRGDERGVTWSGPEIVRPALASPAWETCHHIVELSDGRWLAPTSTWRGWNGENPAGEQAVVLISEDLGKSWSAVGRTFDGRDSGLIHWEQSVVPLQDGRILAVAWVHDPVTGHDLPTSYAISTDGGYTFAQQQPTGLNGQTCKALQLRDGCILCIYRRNDQPGLWANLSSLDGDRWINLAECRLWQGVASPTSSQMSSVEALATLRFGYPSLKELAYSEVFLVFWCVEDYVSNVRWMRLGIER